MAPAPVLVLDTNTLFDWRVFGEPAACAVGDAICAGRVHWLASEALWAEWAYTLARPLDPRWEAARAAALADLTTARTWVRWQPQPAPRPAGPRCRDADDQKFIDLALAHGGCTLLTRDKALRRLARRVAPLGVRVCSAAEWLRAAPR